MMGDNYTMNGWPLHEVHRLMDLWRYLHGDRMPSQVLDRKPVTDSKVWREELLNRASTESNLYKCMADIIAVLRSL